ncbi:MAG: hypothetical protein ABUL62_09740 [Myxococcales bacterium]
MSAASQLDDSAPDAPGDAEERGPVSESSRPTEPRSWSVPAPPVPPMRDRLSTHELEELDELGADAHFDFHDTIPAPPWLDELDEADYELQP